MNDGLRTREDLSEENQLNTYNYTQMDKGNVPLRTKNEESPLILLNDYRSETQKSSNTQNSNFLQADLKTFALNKCAYCTNSAISSTELVALLRAPNKCAPIYTASAPALMAIIPWYRFLAGASISTFCFMLQK